MKKKLPVILILLIVALAIFIGMTSLYVVNEGETVYITQFGAIKRINDTPGLAFRTPFIQNVNRITRKMMIYNVNPSEVLTADKKAMIVDSFALWNISDVTQFIRTVGNIAEMQKRIDASVYSVIKNLMGKLEQSEIIADTETLRDNLNLQISEQVSQSLKGYGVNIAAVEIKRYDLPQDNMEAVHNRMISERAQMAAAYKADGEYEAAKIRNETDKRVNIMIGEANAQAARLRGEGESEYMKILQELYNDPAKAEFYRYVRSLEALKKSLAGWGEKTVILGPDSPITEILKNVQSR